MSSHLDHFVALSSDLLATATGGQAVPAGATPGPTPGSYLVGARDPSPQGLFQQSQELRGAGWNVTRDIVPGTGTPGALGNTFRIFR